MLVNDLLNKVVIFKTPLAEYIGKVKLITDKVVVLDTPLEIQIVQDERGFGQAFAPFSLSEQTGEFTFNMGQCLVNPFEPHEQLRNAYLQATTGLIVPDKPSIIV